MNLQKKRSPVLSQGAQNSSADSEDDALFPAGMVVEDADLSATVGAFRSRIRKKKEEKEAVDEVVEKACKQRHQLMMETLMTIRRSLNDVARIDLGERFGLYLEADDWRGWPRLIIRLEDAFAPETEFPTFKVSAHDRQAQGIVEITYRHDAKPEKISVTNQLDLKRLPTTLKRCVRSFLDLIEEIVLNQDAYQEDEEANLSQKEIVKPEGEQEEASGDAIDANLFSEDVVSNDFLERLPSIEDLDTLPDFDE